MNASSRNLVIVSEADQRMAPAGKNRSGQSRGQRRATIARNRVRDAVAFESRRRNR